MNVETSPYRVEGAASHYANRSAGISPASFSQQAAAALERSYVSMDLAYLMTLKRRQEALRRWRGLSPNRERP